MVARRRSPDWEPPSEHLAELLRRGVLTLLDEADELLATMDTAIFEVNSDLLELAPELTDPLRAAARSNVMVWATANLRKPGIPVPANLGPENLDFARDVVRHGFDETILSGFRVGQNLALRAITDVAFRVTDDHEDLRALLELASASVFAYVENTLDGITATIRAERSHLRDAASAARAEAIALILEGAPISERRASELLKYDVGRIHTAAIVWGDDSIEDGALEAATTRLARLSGSVRPLILPVGPSTLWVWLSGKRRPDPVRLVPERDEAGGVRVALGTAGHGLAGFRRSHHEAVTTQRRARSPTTRTSRWSRLPAPTTSRPESSSRALSAHSHRPPRSSETRFGRTFEKSAI